MSAGSPPLHGPPPHCPRCGALLPPIVARQRALANCPDCGLALGGSSEYASSSCSATGAAGESPTVRAPIPAIDDVLFQDDELNEPFRERAVDDLRRSKSGETWNEDERPARPDRIHYEPDPEPAVPMLSGIYSFPWSSGAWQRWLSMASVLIVACEVVMLSVLYSGVMAGGGGASIDMVGGLIAGLPTTAIAATALAYVSACCLAVIEDTSAGCDAVQEWPPADWREWFWALLYPLMAVGIAGIVGNVVKLFTGGEWNVAASVAMLLFFPIGVLSALESGTPWMPLSAPILISLVRCPLAWLLFYGQSLLVLLGTGWLAGMLLEEHPFAGLLLVAPLLAAVLLICSRLLGRVALFASFKLGEAEEDGEVE